MSLYTGGIGNAFYQQVTWFENRDNVAEMQLPRVSGIRMKPREHQEFMFLANYVNKHVPHDQIIFLSLHRHDVTIVSHSNLYFILEGMNPTWHDQLHPCAVEREDIQRQIIEDLEDNAVSVIILQHIFNDEKLDKLKLKLGVGHMPNVQYLCL